jgi:hypothetical protein
MTAYNFKLQNSNVIAETDAAARSIAVGTTEDTITLDIDTYKVAGKKVFIQGNGDAWGISDKTGAYGTKLPMTDGQYMAVDCDKNLTKFFVQASSGTVTLRVWVAGNTRG